MPINIVLRKIKILPVILLCIGVSGCAATSTKFGHMASNVENMHFKELDDEQLLILFHRIYNEPVQTQVDEIAKDITITAFMIALDSRRSKVIKGSGVVEKPYEKVELDKWTDDELLILYNSLWEELERKETDNENVEKTIGVDGRIYWAFKDRTKRKETEKNEETFSIAKNEATLEIIHLTAFYAVEGERNRRNAIKCTWHSAGSTVIRSVHTAAQVAMMLAGFFVI